MPSSKRVQPREGMKLQQRFKSIGHCTPRRSVRASSSLGHATSPPADAYGRRQATRRRDKTINESIGAPTPLQAQGPNSKSPPLPRPRVVKGTTITQSSCPHRRPSTPSFIKWDKQEVVDTRARPSAAPGMTTDGIALRPPIRRGGRRRDHRVRPPARRAGRSPCR